MEGWKEFIHYISCSNFNTTYLLFYSLALFLHLIFPWFLTTFSTNNAEVKRDVNGHFEKLYKINHAKAISDRKVSTVKKQMKQQFKNIKQSWRFLDWIKPEDNSIMSQNKKISEDKVHSLSQQKTYGRMTYFGFSSASCPNGALQLYIKFKSLLWRNTHTRQ